MPRGRCCLSSCGGGRVKASRFRRRVGDAIVEEHVRIRVDNTRHIMFEQRQANVWVENKDPIDLPVRPWWAEISGELVWILVDPATTRRCSK